MNHLCYTIVMEMQLLKQMNRTRKLLKQMNRTRKLLKQMNIKLGSYLSK